MPEKPGLLISMTEDYEVRVVSSRKGRLELSCKLKEGGTTEQGHNLAATVHVVRSRFFVSRLNSFRKHFKNGRCKVILRIKEPRCES